MAGWDLKHGELNNSTLSEDDYWQLFNSLFSNATKKRNSYKYGLLKSILDNIFNVEKVRETYFISYDALFSKFAENYWNLVVKYNVKQMRKGSLANTSKIELIFSEHRKASKALGEIEFEAIPGDTKQKIINEVSKACRRNVIGALYQDFEGKFYAFDLRGKGLFISEGAYSFCLRFKPEIEKLNYYEWAKFLEQINDDEVLVRIIDKLELSTPHRSDLSIYRDVLYKEFEEHNCFYCGKKLNKNAHVDHFIPWSFTKDDKLWNFVLSCPECNTKKNNKLASKAYLERIQQRNDRLLNANIMKADFNSYKPSLLNDMWNYAWKSGYKEWNPNNRTIDYYNNNSLAYFNSTVVADMSDCYKRFLKYIKTGSLILDAGCGSGRDSKYFLEQGYSVKAIDGSEELCKLASEYVGQEVECINFLDIDYNKEFDAIWACASLLHVNKSDIDLVVNKLYKALKDTGIIYASFKYGDSDRVQGDRYFNDYNEDSIEILFAQFDIKETWFSDDVRPGRSDRWINIIAQKKSS